MTIEKYATRNSGGNCDSVPDRERDIVSALRKNFDTCCNLERDSSYIGPGKRWEGIFKNGSGTEKLPGNVKIEVFQEYAESGSLTGATAQLSYDAGASEQDLKSVRNMVTSSGLESIDA